MSDTRIEEIIRAVAELPDRDSPEDQPEMMLVSADELREILEEQLAASAPLPNCEGCNGTGQVLLRGGKYGSCYTCGGSGVGESLAAPVAAQEPSPTHGMNLGERIAHVGGRTNAAGYVEFGSPMAVDALIQHVLRDLAAQPETWKVLPSPARATGEMLHAEFSPHGVEKWQYFQHQTVWDEYADRVNARLAGERS